MPDLDRLRRGGAGQALAIRNFRLYFCGLMVSVSGTWMQTTAQAWLVLKLTNSPVALATVAALQSLPVMLFTLVGGAIADRLSRRKLLIITQSLAATQALGARHAHRDRPRRHLAHLHPGRRSRPHQHARRSIAPGLRQ